MNNQVYNFSREPLYVIDSNNVGTLAQNGLIYSLAIGSASVAALSSQYAQLTNPSNSGKTIYIYKIILSNSGTSLGLRTNIYRNGSFSNVGTSVTPYNTNFTSTNTSLATFKYSGTTGTLVNTQLLMTFLQPTSNFTEDVDFMISMPPGSTLLFQFENILISLLQTISINIIWAEI